MNPDEWLRENTFFCEPYMARITPAQCEINRERDNLPGTPTQAPIGITACNGCDWERMQGKNGGNEMSDVEICLECGEEKRIQARGVCAKCYSRLKKEGNLDKHPAKPRGGDTRKRPGKLEQAEQMDLDLWLVCAEAATEYPLAQEQILPDPGPEPGCRECRNASTLDAIGAPQLRLFFGSVPGGQELYKWIIETAERDLRSPEMQIMIILRRAKNKE